MYFCFVYRRYSAILMLFLHTFEIVDREVVVTYYKFPPDGAAYRLILVQARKL